MFFTSHVVISRHVEMGQNTLMTVDSTVADTVKIGRDNSVGPNALSTTDIEEGATDRVKSITRSPVGSFRFLRVESR